MTRAISPAIVCSISTSALRVQHTERGSARLGAIQAQDYLGSLWSIGLRRADLRHAMFIGANFQDADLEGAVVSDLADLGGIKGTFRGKVTVLPLKTMSCPAMGFRKGGATGAKRFIPIGTGVKGNRESPSAIR